MSNILSCPLSHRQSKLHVHCIHRQLAIGVSTFRVHARRHITDIDLLTPRTCILDNISGATGRSTTGPCTCFDYVLGQKRTFGFKQKYVLYINWSGAIVAPVLFGNDRPNVRRRNEQERNIFRASVPIRVMRSSCVTSRVTSQACHILSRCRIFHHLVRTTIKYSTDQHIHLSLRFDYLASAFVYVKIRNILK